MIEFVEFVDAQVKSESEKAENRESENGSGGWLQNDLVESNCTGLAVI